MVTHSRRLYGVFDILGELAGVTSVVSTILIFEYAILVLVR
jgi:hypothetical protein